MLTYKNKALNALNSANFIWKKDKKYFPIFSQLNRLVYFLAVCYRFFFFPFYFEKKKKILISILCALSVKKIVQMCKCECCANPCDCYLSRRLICSQQENTPVAKCRRRWWRWKKITQQTLFTDVFCELKIYGFHFTHFTDLVW